jgi:hypothetical protein
MKIRQHPRMKDIVLGDEVLCYRTNLYALVEEVFPAAVCVKLLTFDRRRKRFVMSPQLWRAEEIENLSICRYCGSRDGLTMENGTSFPQRICFTCRSVVDHATDFLTTSTDR